ncbi:hypothetical protein VC83_03399 [Pseudogymnoascus destructans]|uniref:Ecp2 effector protein domain-containing protein n=2 Tax=Pseudogymnoascus destructans TaxID=655981 RepID=L8FSR4_PSED2|nr:uncharacterized protein VC83_03399 [Pseudogymnoascus destructans]ELR03523.1 hypothetical protein GMDG_01274 [Pseudogymnoascus destructans 20631-21]OAF60656.1 hypothetical protein VC83_03399 [Pseudogymnoascus destructans]
MAKLSTHSFALLAFATTLISAPVADSTNPPSLNSLNLTTRADLNTCSTVQLTRSNILLGINYLISLGNTPCVVGQESVVFVTKGDVAITGYNGLMGGETSAPCHDVGIAARWIMNHCALAPLAFGGTTTAIGKKEVVIRVRKA